MGFWLALVISSIFLPFIWILGSLARWRMRKVFSMRRRHCLDCVAWFFCACCALVQEHKFMERVFAASRRGETRIEIGDSPPTYA
jgi:Cys-rich protein (TIGR01571 family)